MYFTTLLASKTLSKIFITKYVSEQHSFSEMIKGFPSTKYGKLPLSP